MHTIFCYIGGCHMDIKVDQVNNINQVERLVENQSLMIL